MLRLIGRTFGGLVLAGQATLFAWWLQAPEPAAHLTPYEGQVSYRLHVSRNGRALGFGEIERRYRIPAVGRTSQTPASLQEIVRAVEDPRRSSEHVVVRLHHRVNEQSEEVWLWPEN